MGLLWRDNALSVKQELLFFQLDVETNALFWPINPFITVSLTLHKYCSQAGDITGLKNVAYKQLNSLRPSDAYMRQ